MGKFVKHVVLFINSGQDSSVQAYMDAYDVDDCMAVSSLSHFLR